MKSIIFASVSREAHTEMDDCNFVLIIAVFPIWWMFNIAFSDPGTPVSVNPVVPILIFCRIQNIIKAITENNNQFLKAYLNTTLYTAFTIIGTLIFAQCGL